MADDVPKVTIKVDSIEMTSTVESVDVEDHDRAIDRARVVFDDSQAQASQILREQSKLQVTLGWSSESALIFEGVVMSVKTEASGMAKQRVTVTAYDLSYRLKQGTPKKRTFTSGKLSDAIKAIVAEYADKGITIGQVLPDPDEPIQTFAPLTKREGQTDWDFIQDLARKSRARAFVEVNDNKSQFYFVSEASLLKGDPMGRLLYCPGGAGKLVEFTYQRVGSGAAPASTTTVIDPKTGDPVVKQAAPPAPEPPLKVDDQADAALEQAADAQAKAASKPEEARPVPVASGQPSDPKAVEQKLQQDPTRLLGYHGRGVAIGTIKLRAKGKVTIAGLSPWAEGDWYVHKVNHVYQRIVVTGAKLEAVDRSTFQSKFSATR